MLLYFECRVMFLDARLGVFCIYGLDLGRVGGCFAVQIEAFFGIFGIIIV